RAAHDRGMDHRRHTRRDRRSRGAAGRAGRGLMAERPAPRVFSIAPGVPFLETLADALLQGRLVPGAPDPADPLALADTTIYLPTRRAARSFRSVLAEKLGGAAILPVVRPLGEFDEEADLFDASADTLDLAPPLGGMERLLLLAPL